MRFCVALIKVIEGTSNNRGFAVSGDPTGTVQVGF